MRRHITEQVRKKISAQYSHPTKAFNTKWESRGNAGCHKFNLWTINYKSRKKKCGFQAFVWLSRVIQPFKGFLLVLQFRDDGSMYPDALIIGWCKSNVYKDRELILKGTKIYLNFLVYSQTFFFSLGQLDSSRASAVVVNKSHAVFFSYVRSTISQEKIESMWTGYKRPCQHCKWVNPGLLYVQSRS